jgi:hypothetical protein
MASTKQMQEKAKILKRKMASSNKSVYHYTKGYSVEGILKEGFIALEGTRGKIAMKPITSFVWLTEGESYPITALPYVHQLPYTWQLNHMENNKPQIKWDELSSVIGGIYRFKFNGIDHRLEKWKDCLFRKNNISIERIKYLELSANEMGDSINKFWISSKNLELKNCYLQRYDEGNWIDLLAFDCNGFISSPSNFTLDGIIESCQIRLCA